MPKNINKKGFTLIELLVVISIISFLSSIVLASLNTAKTKANEAVIKSNLKNITSQAELLYSETGNYANITASSSAMLDAISKTGATSACKGYSGTPPTWSCSSKSADGTKYWSVGPTGVVNWNPVNRGPLPWAAATTFCSNLGQRLPTVAELETLYFAGAIKEPNFTSSIPYWSSSIVTIYGNINIWTFKSTGGPERKAPNSLINFNCVYP